MEKYFELIDNLKEFLLEHSDELYLDDTKRMYYADLLDLEQFLKSNYSHSTVNEQLGILGE